MNPMLQYLLIDENMDDHHCDNSQAGAALNFF